MTEAERSRFMPTIRERRMLLGKNSRDFGAIGESGFGSANACTVPEIQRASFGQFNYSTLSKELSTEAKQ